MKFNEEQEIILWNALGRYKQEVQKEYSNHRDATIEAIDELIEELELEPQVREAKKHNCWYCGRSGSRGDVQLGQGRVNGKDKWMCRDDEDCESEHQAKKHDYPENLEDTPSVTGWWEKK